jgi:hypothetical protein
MASAEINAPSHRAIGANPSRWIHPNVRQVLSEIAVVSRESVIAVHAVLKQQLPIGLHAVGLRALHDLDILAAEIDHVVEIFLGVSKIALEALDLRIVADEDHAPVVLHAWHRPEPHLVALERGRIGLRVRHAQELAR